MIKNAKKTPKEQIAELHTGISIEQWEENNRRLDQIMKVKEEQLAEQAVYDDMMAFEERFMNSMER